MSLEAFPPPLLVPLQESPHVVGAPGEPAFVNGWTQFEATAAARAARFWRTTDGIVHLGGIVKGGASGTAVFTLPAGYAPVGGYGDLSFITLGSNITPVWITVSAAGVVIATNIGASSVTAYAYLDGISFQGSQPVGQTLYDPSSVAFYGTTPPANPVDGMRWVFPADAANGVMWTFRYRGGGTYPWEFVGGSDMVASDMAFVTYTVAATTWAQFPTPTLVAPRAGEYETFGRIAVANTSDATKIGALIRTCNALTAAAAATGVGWSSDVTKSANNSGINSSMVSDPVITMTAGAVLYNWVWSSITGVTFGERSLRIRPRRIA